MASIAAVLVVVAAVVTTVVIVTGDDSDSSTDGASPGTSATQTSTASSTASASEPSKITSLLRAYAAAFAGKRGDVLPAVMCVNDLEQAQRLLAGLSSPPTTAQEVSVRDIAITGTKATAKVAFGPGQPEIDVTMIQENGSWKVCPSGR